jgi:citronellyl-CoA synthetase
MENEPSENEKKHLDRVSGKLRETVFTRKIYSMGICLEKLVEDVPDKIALLFEDKSWNWKEVNIESNKFTNYFLNIGLKPQDTVGIILENSPEYLFCTLGISKIQGISALVNINQRKQALIHAIKIVDAKKIIIDGENLSAFNEIFNELSLNKTDVFVINNHNQIHHDFIDLTIKLEDVSKNNPKTTFNSKPTEIGYYIYTSGTTGLPKAIYAINIGGSTFYSAALQMNSEDILYNTLPLYHGLSISIWAGAMVSQSTMALRKKFSASEFWKDIKKYNATGTVYIGEIPRYLLNRPESEYVENKTLKKMLGLGLRKEIWEQFKARFKIEHIWELYGMSEARGGFFNADERPGMVGRVLDERIKIVRYDESTSEFIKNDKDFYVQCVLGEIGMVISKIETLDNQEIKIYKNPENTNKKILRNVFETGDAYFNTGDLVMLHENNWVSFADRMGDTFRWKGENVSTTEVESILSAFPSIKICSVYGVAIPHTDGKAGMITIVLNENKFEIENFSKYVLENLPSYAVPMFLRITQNLELTGTLKVIKYKLRKEGYNVENLKDPVYFWDASLQKYVVLNQECLNKLANGLLKI